MESKIMASQTSSGFGERLKEQNMKRGERMEAIFLCGEHTILLIHGVRTDGISLNIV